MCHVCHVSLYRDSQISDWPHTSHASLTGDCLERLPWPPDLDPEARSEAGAESELGPRLQRAGEAEQTQRGRAQDRGHPLEAPAMLHSHLILVRPQTRGGGDHMVPS